MKAGISRTALAVAGAIAAFVVVALLFGFTVVSTEEEAAMTVEFDPVVHRHGRADPGQRLLVLPVRPGRGIAELRVDQPDPEVGGRRLREWPADAHIT